MSWNTSTVRLLLVVPLLAAGVSLGMSRPAAAAETCTGTIISATIKSSVIVPANADCDLYGVVVRGGITVETGASLEVDSGSEVRGSIVATGFVRLEIQQSVVRGSITGTGAFDADHTTVEQSEIRGNLTLTGNASDYITIEGSVFRGTVTISYNSTIDDAIEIYGNQIDVDLVCEGNTPEPRFGGGSTVGGTITGQCQNLQP